MRETAQTRVASLFFRSRVSVLQKVGERTEFVLSGLIEKVMYRTLLNVWLSEFEEFNENELRTH